MGVTGGFKFQRTSILMKQLLEHAAHHLRFGEKILVGMLITRPRRQLHVQCNHWGHEQIFPRSAKPEGVWTLVSSNSGALITN